MTTPAASGSDRHICLNMVLSPEGVAEMFGEHRLIFIPKEEVQVIEARFGSTAVNPLVQGGAGFLLAGAGLGGGIYLWQGGGMNILRWVASALIFGGVGLWLLWETFRQRPFLRIVRRGEACKLIFSGPVPPAELEALLAAAEKMGYLVKNCLPTR